MGDIVQVKGREMFELKLLHITGKQSRREFLPRKRHLYLVTVSPGDDGAVALITRTCIACMLII